jgi:hypothetical protein
MSSTVVAAQWRAVGAAQIVNKPPRFFTADRHDAAGRRILYGFSYLQRIGKAAHTELWLPATQAERLTARLAAGDHTVLDDAGVEWAAVRQFELLQEAGNLAIEDLEVGNLKRSFEYLMRMRAGGYRVTVITLGDYVTAARDELAILDQRLQEEITRLINMIYLDAHSAQATVEQRQALRSGGWQWEQALKHVAQSLQGAAIFNRRSRQDALQRRFFEILSLLPQRHVAHDVALGLTLPEAAKQLSWIYLAKGEHKAHAFQQALTDVFRGFDHINLGRLQGRADAPSEVKATMGHLRGYGDHVCGGWRLEARG